MKFLIKYLKLSLKSINSIIHDSPRDAAQIERDLNGEIDVIRHRRITHHRAPVECKPEKQLWAQEPGRAGVLPMIRQVVSFNKGVNDDRDRCQEAEEERSGVQKTDFGSKKYSFQKLS